MPAYFNQSGWYGGGGTINVPTGFQSVAPQMTYTSYGDAQLSEYISKMAPFYQKPPETPEGRARRLAAEYAQYMQSIQTGAREGMPYSQYMTQFAMTPQQWAAEEALKNKPITMELKGGITKKWKSEQEDPFVTIERTTPSGGKVKKRIRLSEQIAGLQAEGQKAGLEATAKNAKSLAMFQNMAANDPEFKNNPEIAAQLGKGVEAIARGVDPISALDMVKGLGKSPEIKAQRAKDIRLEIESKHQDLRMDVINKQFENAQELKNMQLDYQRTKDDLDRAIRESQNAAINARDKANLRFRIDSLNRKLEMDAEKMRTGVGSKTVQNQRTIAALNTAIKDLKNEQSGLDQASNKYIAIQSLIDEYSSTIKNLQEVQSVYDEARNVVFQPIDISSYETPSAEVPAQMPVQPPAGAAPVPPQAAPPQEVDYFAKQIILPNGKPMMVNPNVMYQIQIQNEPAPRRVSGYQLAGLASAGYNFTVMGAFY